MHPIYFEGSTEVKKPDNMSDEECSSVWAESGVDGAGYRYFVTAWRPSYEDLLALNNGEPIYIKSLVTQLVPMIPYTLDVSGTPNVE